MASSSTVYGVLSLPVNDRIAAIRACFSFSDVDLVCASLEVDRAGLCLVIGVPSPSRAKRKLEETRRLDQAASERLLRIVEIEQRAQKVLGCQELAREWLTTVNAILGVAPIQLLDTAVGGNLVRKVLVEIEQGLPV